MADPKNDIATLNQELIPVKEKRNNLNQEAKKWVEKRNTLNEKVRNMRKDASEIKEKRDAINKQVQELKNLRNQVSAKGKEKRTRISELQEKISQLHGNRRSGNLRQVARQIEEIDWKIQTTSLPIKEEQDLVNQVKKLENQLIVQKQIKQVEKRISSLQTIEKKINNEAKIIHKKLSEIAEKSQKYHSQMLDILERIHKLKDEADDSHKRFIEIKEKAQKLHQQCVVFIEEIRSIEINIKEKADKKQAKRQSELKEELEKRALAKFKRGEKLMWEEFQILAEKGML